MRCSCSCACGNSRDEHWRESETLTRTQRTLRTQQPEEVYLNLVLEFVPETIYRIIKHYSRTKRQVPGLYVKVRAANRAQEHIPYRSSRLSRSAGHRTTKKKIIPAW